MSKPPVALATDRLSLARKIAYAMPIVPSRAMYGPLLSSVPALYAKYSAIGMARIGLALTVLRLFDVVIDPTIGFASDRTRTRWGGRRPWIVAGVVMSAVSVPMLFHPGPGVGVAQFTIAMAAVNLGWTLIEIPHSAWLGEISHDYDERSQLSAWRTGASYLGLFAVAALPLLPIFPDAAMTPRVLEIAGWAIVATLPIAAIVALAAVPAGRATPAARAGIFEVGRSLFTRGPLRILYLSQLLSSIASGMCGALYLFYLDTYLGIIGRFAWLGLGTAAVGMVASALWPAILARIGKRLTLVIAHLTTAATLLGMAAIRPGPAAFLLLSILFAASELLSAGEEVAIGTMIVDSADYDMWRTGTSKLGSAFAASAVCDKMGTALGGAASFLVVALFGFDPRHTNGAMAMVGFFLAIIALPVLFNVAAALVAARFPITRDLQRGVEDCLAHELL